MLNILDVAQSGLKISQTQVENVMNNLANENTPGYKTRVVDVSESAHIDARITGRGVSIEGISRVTNVYMYQNLVNESSKESALKELDVMLNDIESIFYETDDAGLSADLNRYFQSIENLKTSPQNEIYKNDLANNANILLGSLKTIYSDIETREATTINTASDMVEEVNNILRSIGDISEQILYSTVPVNDLYDKRDALEKELAQYVDIEISRDLNYELKIAGITAIRFDSNVHEIHLVEDYTYQKDVYTKEGTMTTSSLIQPTWGDGTAAVPEKQTITVEGAATAPVSFLGHPIAGSVSGDSAENTIDRIIADKANIISTWNAIHPDRKINDITKTSASELTVVYDDLMGDVPPIDPSQSSGIVFAKSLESVKGKRDSITYRLNDSVEVTVTEGETLTFDVDGNGTNDVVTVNKDNLIRSLVYKINSLADTKDLITAYNGDYVLDKDGNKVLRTPLNQDHYLVIEANFPGTKNSFDGTIIVTDAGASSVHTIVDRNSTLSDDAQNNVHLEIYDNPITIDSGMLKPMLDNVNTTSYNNYYQDYKDKLDLFAQKLADLSNGFIENSDGTYVWGASASELKSNYDETINIGLFSGSSVKSLEFNANMINTLTQQKLDYLADLQWKDDIDFDGTGENLTSFSKFYQELRVDLADDRENIIFKKESQMAVRESLELTYDKLTKVDSDEQMIELIKFQSAYEANAKMITIVDEMLQTLLGIAR